METPNTRIKFGLEITGKELSSFIMTNDCCSMIYLFLCLVTTESVWFDAPQSKISARGIGLLKDAHIFLKCLSYTIS